MRAPGRDMAEPRFEGKLCVEWLHENGADRRIRLIHDLCFVDARGERWLARSGSVIDPAGIPRVLSWPLSDSPFTGACRRAAVIHSAACAGKLRPAREVHRMFYEALVCEGMDRSQALELYAGVRLFGPDWPVPGAEADDYDMQPQRTIDDVEAALDAILDD